jgi:GGDEF domain-containing protein
VVARRDLKWPIAPMMIDVDHCKRFDGNYGHLNGDQRLRAIGDTLAAAGVRAAPACLARTAPTQRKR